MSDYLLKTLAKEAGVRILICTTTNLVNEAATRHEATPIAAIALAEGLTGAALLGALLKDQQRIAIKFDANGPLKKIAVESDSSGNLRGYIANTELNIPPSKHGYNTASALGSVGVLTVIKDLRLKKLAESSVPMGGGRIDEELTYYLNQSEQIPSFVEIGIVPNEDGTIQIAGGLLLQAIPPYNAEIINQVQNRIQELPPLADLFRDGQTPETLLKLLFDQFEYDILERRGLMFNCQCSWERSEKALILMGREGIEDLIKHEGEAVVDCHFCHERYIFDQDDLEDILAELD